MPSIKMTGCMALVAKLPQHDVDAMLARLDRYQAMGMDPQAAQSAAAQDTLSELQADRTDYLASTKEQHAHLFPIVDKPQAEPETAELPAGEATEIEPGLVANEPQAAYEAAPEPLNETLAEAETATFAKPKPNVVERGKGVLQQVGTSAGRESLRGSMKDYLKGLKEWVLTQGFDQYRAAATKLSSRAYMLMRLSTNGYGTLEAILGLGKPKVDGDVVDVTFDKQGGFLGELAEATKGEHQQFLKWVAALRAKDLMGQGREHLFTAERIALFLDPDKGYTAGKMKDGTSRADAYQKALGILTAYNDAVLQVGMSRGLLTPGLYESFRDDPYLPFYRKLETEADAIRWSTALTGQVMFKELKGGAGQLPDDLLSNVLRNWSHVFTAAAKNHAANVSLNEMAELGLAERIGARGAELTALMKANGQRVGDVLKGAVWTMENGVQTFWQVRDEALGEAIGAMSYVMPEWQRPLATFKRVLTMGVTSMPGFKLKNPIRDTFQALALSTELSTNPLENLKAGAKPFDVRQSLRNLASTALGRAPASFLAQNQEFATMLATGGVLRFGNMVEGDRATRAEHLVRRANQDKGVMLDAKGGRKLLDMMDDAWTAYQETTDVGEQINRSALFQRMVDKGYSKAEAAFAARDLMDFTLQGKAPLVRFLVQTVPFLNARMQGLYKLGRAATSGEKYEALGINKRFANVAGSITLASLALMLAQQDDKDWKEREDWDRDSYWWFKIGGTAFRLPKPFEVGAIGTLAERTWEMMFDKDMTMRRYAERVSSMLTSTFSFNPTPQFAKPLIDIYANREGFTGRNIETKAMQERMPEDRYSESTSMLARMLGDLGLPNPLGFVNNGWGPGKNVLSPVQIDYLMAGYFGGLATVLNGAIDMVAKPLAGEGKKPAASLKAMTFSFIDELPAEQSRYVQQFYDRYEQVHEAFQSYTQAMKVGDRDRALAIMAEHKGEIAQRSTLEAAKRQLAVLNTQAQRVNADKTLDSDTKRARLDAIAQRRASLAARVDERLPAF